MMYDSLGIIRVPLDAMRNNVNTYSGQHRLHLFALLLCKLHYLYWRQRGTIIIPMESCIINWTSLTF